MLVRGGLSPKASFKAIFKKNILKRLKLTSETKDNLRVFCCLVLKGIFEYHAPQKHYLPGKILPELFLKLPLNDWSFSELISKNYPMPFVFM